MKIFAIALTALLLMATTTFGQGTMDPSYSSYITDDSDNLNYYQTVVVDGITTGS
jgi:hypothetical protein